MEMERMIVLTQAMLMGGDGDASLWKQVQMVYRWLKDSGYCRLKKRFHRDERKRA